jgi:hypothetical protein
MDPGLKLAGYVFSRIIKKVKKMKTGEDKTKKAEKSGGFSKVAGALVAGATVGLAAGILLAPDKGKKTRAALLEDAKDLADKLKKKAGDALNPSDKE